MPAASDRSNCASVQIGLGLQLGSAGREAALLLTSSSVECYSCALKYPLPMAGWVILPDLLGKSALLLVWGCARVRGCTGAAGEGGGASMRAGCGHSPCCGVHSAGLFLSGALNLSCCE